jgi:anti-sigma factor RsiW
MNSTSHPSDDLLNAWIDGVATGDERQVIAEHLDVCAACRAELESLLLVKQLLSELPEPALPRSFKLTLDDARQPAPIRETSQPSTVVRLLPIVRILSIAAVLALLVLGGATALGPVSDSLSGNDADMAADSVTDWLSGASEETYPTRMAIAPGEVVDQGQAATSSNSAMDAMGDGLQQADAEASNDRSTLKVATLTAGIFALVMVGLWILLSQLNRARSTTEEEPVSRKDG